MANSFLACHLRVKKIYQSKRAESQSIYDPLHFYFDKQRNNHYREKVVGGCEFVRVKTNPGTIFPGPVTGDGEQADRL